MAFKSGFVTIIGRPNVGKSTLLNKLSGEKIAITSDKPQTTRNTIKTVVTEKDCQIIFMDTPGIHKPKTKLGKYMVGEAQSSINEVDIVLFLVEATSEKPGVGDQFIIDQLKGIKNKIFLIINKIDLIRKDQLLPIIKAYGEVCDFTEIIPVSALNDEGTQLVLKTIINHLPEGPKYFPDDMLTDQPERILAAEIIREKILRLLDDEVPHGVGVEILTFKEREGKDLLDVQANIYCEKDSHKGIIIGKQGAMLKRIGSMAREDMEGLMGVKVFLELWVKVKTDWRNSDNMLKTLGYK